MTDTRKTITKVIEKKDYTHKEAIKAWKSWVVVHTDWGGYTEDELELYLWADGSMTISDDNNFISLNKTQVDFILKFLDVNP